jgi:hypothetical protein
MDGHAVAARFRVATAAYGARWSGFNGGGAASVKRKNYLRALLAQHAGTEAAEAVRDFFNLCREDGELICNTDVAAAIETLKTL